MRQDREDRSSVCGGEINHSAMANAAARGERDAKLTGAFYIAAK